MLVRIKKVLENERRKLAEKSSKTAAAGPAGGVRKGGRAVEEMISPVLLQQGR